jgi:hypothetical protein
MNGLDYDPDELTLSGINVKGFFTNVKNTVKTVGQKVGDTAKVAVKAVVKFNPLSIAARGGFLLAMKLNLGKMAAKLKWAYGTQQQAAAKNVNAATWQKSKNALANVESLFADKLQGSKEVLKNSILKGRAGNLNGMMEEQMLGYLGDPVSASAIAAATPVIIATIKIIKDSGLFAKNENVDMNSISSELTSNPDASAAVAEIQASEAISTNESTPGATSSNETTVDAKTATAGSGGIMNFIKANPVPAAIGGGLLAFGIYQMVKPKKKIAGLSGYKSKRKTTDKKSLPKKTNKMHQHKNGARNHTIKTVKLF